MKIKILLNIIILFWILTLIFSVSGCVFSPWQTNFDATNLPVFQNDRLGKSTQVIVVKDERCFFFTRARMYVMEKKGDNWKNIFGPIDAAIGRNGFAPPGEKKEGDGRTPSGIYPLKMTFGYNKAVKTKMPYRQAGENDIWVDDPRADDYNRWTEKHKTNAVSYEMMKRDDNLYKYGIIIEYNTAPVIKGNGSAIFLHIWKGKGIPTAGCVAVSEENLIKILEWLDPAAAPLIITGVKN